jgi:hypothetical protein
MATVRHLGLFPFCFTIKESATFSTENDIKEKAVPMWWRVKEWRLESTVTARSLKPNPATGQFVEQTNSATDFFDVQILHGLQSEKNLVCLIPFFSNVFQHFFTAATDFDTIGLDDIDYEALTLIVGPEFEFYLANDNRYGAGTQQPGEDVGSLSVNYAEISFSAPMYKEEKYEPEDGFNIATEVVGYTGSLTAIEYWPYDPEDGGGPIYDSATGAQLRDFPAS